MYRNFIFKSDFGEFVIFKILSSELYQIKKVICYCFLWFYGIYLFPCFVSNKVYMFVYFKIHIFFVKLNSVRWGGRGFPPPTLRKKKQHLQKKSPNCCYFNEHMKITRTASRPNSNLKNTRLYYSKLSCFIMLIYTSLQQNYKYN